MLPEIKLTITRHDKLIETVTKIVEKQHLVKSLEEFQIEANAAITKMIEEMGDSSEAGGDSMGDEDEDEEDANDEDDDADSSLSENGDRKGHSKSKKKKHS